MPRVAAKPKPEGEVKQRTPAQLANDERLRNRAKLAPVVTRKMTESQEQTIGQTEEPKFDKNGDLPQTKLPSFLADGKRVRSQKWFEDMAFANETVTVMIHDTKDKTDNPFPEVWVNGRVQRFVRGVEQQCRRCYVERLARMKKTTYDSLKTKDVDGEDVYRYPPHTALEYPFVVIGDSEKGKQWLKSILAEPG